MPSKSRKKHLENEILRGFSKQEGMIVQKSQPLMSLWRSQLTLEEFKIMDVYLSRINSHEPDKRTVIFEKGELEEILKVKYIREDELEQRLKHLGTPVRIDDTTAKNKRFAMVSLFDESFADQDPDTGLWMVTMTASQSAMKYFFNVDQLGYLRYKLQSVVKINSRYSYILFIYLENHRKYRKTRCDWIESLDNLKTILRCDKNYYKQYKKFNDKVLRRIHQELTEKTELRYSYEPIKKGRSVVAIHFILDPVSTEIVDVKEAQPEQEQLESDNEDKPEVRELWMTALDDLKLSKEQIEYIRSLLAAVRPALLPVNANFDNDHLDGRWFTYLDQKVKQMEIMDKKKAIKNKYAYLCKMVKQDGMAESTVKEDKSSTNDYDLDTIQKKLTQQTLDKN